MTKLLNNRYQIIRNLGDGGFGETFLAQDTHLPSQRYCVIKQLKPVANNTELLQLTKERFAREAAILEDLGEHHQQIPKLYAYFNDGQQYYLIQEFIEGETLADLVAKQGKISEKIVIQILCKILPVLDYVHSYGIVHRDIKPANIILRNKDNLPVLIDFGAVKETMGTIITNRGNYANSIVIGTPGFMPPEQSIGRPIFSSDLYALSLVAVYLLTGELPQNLPTNPRTGEIILDQYNQTISFHLISILQKAINHHPQDRFATAKDMLRALEVNSTNYVTQQKTNNYIPKTVQFVPNPTEIAQSTEPNKLGLIVFLIVIIIVSILGFGILMPRFQTKDDNNVPVFTDGDIQLKPDNNDQEVQPDQNKPIEPDIVKTITRPSSQKALSNYYQNLNNSNYETAWYLLSPESRNNQQRHPQGYQSYLDWWQQVDKVNILTSNLIEENEEAAIIDGQLEYKLKSGKVIEQSLIFNFLWSENDQKWLLNDVNQISEKIIKDAPLKENKKDKKDKEDKKVNISPQDFVKNHYDMINSREYEASWNNLSKDFQDNKLKNDYQSYVNWWETVEKVEVEKIDLIKEENDKATVETSVKYNMKNDKVGFDKLQMSLIRDKNTDKWLFENTVKVE